MPYLNICSIKVLLTQKMDCWLVSMFNIFRTCLMDFSLKSWNTVSMLFSFEFPNHFEKLDICDVLLFCHDVDRPINLCGKAYSPLLDTIREDFESRGLSCKSIAHFGCYLTGNKGYGHPLSFNHSYIWYKVKRKILKLFGLSISFKHSIYLRILQKTGAKLVLTIGCPAELASAAKFKGIYHVELLHGIGYTFLPWNWDKLSPEYLPHAILSLDEVSTKSFAPLKDKGIEIRTISNPFLKRFTTKNIDLQPAEWRVKLDNLKEYKASILVSFNWGYAGDHGDYLELANILANGLFFEEIGELVREEPSIFWHFRFHPVQLRKKCYDKHVNYMNNFVLLHRNSEWVEASRVPFPAIAMQCDGHISMSSMSCYDAASVGVPSLMLCPNVQKGGIYQDLFTDLEDEGYILKLKVNKEVLRNWVHQTHKVKPRLSNLLDDGPWESAVELMLHKSELHLRSNSQDPK